MSLKVLVIGATGAMGQYLVPELLSLGYSVDAVAVDDNHAPENPNLRKIKADVFAGDFLQSTVKNGGYDAIVDFMIYNDPAKFAEKYMNLFLDNTAQYIFLSSYRVYADSPVITENSPRLLDVPLPDDFVKPFEYSIYKAEEEDLIRATGKRNFTILRPAITYSFGRNQLVTLEANLTVRRALLGKKVLLPDGAMDIQATMSWAGDVARMISRLVNNPKAFGEAFTVSTSEHHSWREVAEIYKKICSLEYEIIPTEDFLRILGGGDYSVYNRQQLLYDRFFNRVVDNSKILDACGMKQSELSSLEDGLRREISRTTLQDLPNTAPEIDKRMDEYIEKML